MLCYDFLRKILCPVMLCLWWHEIKSKILWSVMLVLFVSKILCSVMNLTVCYHVARQKSMRGCIDVVCFLDSIFETLAHIWATLRSLLNELACLTVFTPLIETWEYPWHVFLNSQFDIGNSWNHAQNTPLLFTLLKQFEVRGWSPPCDHRHNSFKGNLKLL